MAQTDRIAGYVGDIALKLPCRVATTGAITLSGLQTIDGIAVAAGDRVLVKDQLSAVENGIYFAATGSWSRTPDFDGARDVVKGTTVSVTDGARILGVLFEVSSENTNQPGVDAITFAGSTSVPASVLAAANSAAAALVSEGAAAGSAAAALVSEGAAAGSAAAALVSEGAAAGSAGAAAGSKDAAAGSAVAAAGSVFIAQGSATAAQVSKNAALVSEGAAAGSANAATTKAAEAAASAQSANGAAGAAKWVSGTTYAEGDVRWSPISYLSYRRKVAGAGTTDPASDPTNWAQIQTDYNNAINPTATAQSINMTAASSGSNGIAVANDADINVGTGNFTLHWEGALPDWTPGAIQRLLWKYDAATTTGYFLTANTNGTVYVNFWSAGPVTDTYISTASHSFVDGTTHKITASITRETALVDGVIVFFVDGLQLGAVVAIPARTPPTLSNTGSLYMLGTSVVRYAGQAKSAILYNRALSAAEVLDLCRNGVAFADRGASQTSLVVGTDSDFSGASNWANANCSVYDETTGGVLTATASAIGQYFRLPIANCPMTAGKKYRIEINVTAATGTWKIHDFSTSYGLVDPTLGTTGLNVYEINVPTGATGGLSFISLQNNSSITMESISVYPSGATLELTPEGIQPAPGQWIDASGNGNHGMQPATGSSLMRPQRTGEVRWTNTWAGTHEAQYVGGVNQNVLPSENIRIESITMRCSAIGVNVILGDSVNTSRWVASVALATYLDATVANRNHDGTNRKIVIDPDAIFTGSITTTIKYIILD